MPTIKLTQRTLEALYTKTRSLSSEASEAAAEAQSAANEISTLDFSACASITANVRRLQKRLNKQADLARQFSTLARAVSDEMAAADGSFGTESNSLWDRVRSWVSDKTQKLSLALKNALSSHASTAGLFLLSSVSAATITNVSRLFELLRKFLWWQQNKEPFEEKLDKDSGVISINDEYVIPDRPSYEIIPHYTNSEGKRGAEAYRQVLSDLDVEGRYRYEPRNGNTWCNIYVWDATKALDCEIPHYYDKKTGEPLTREYCLSHKGEYYEMSAQRMTSWLENYGTKYGWIECSKEEAIAHANHGQPTVCVGTTVGHVAMVAPQNDGETDVMISQAGAVNFEHGSIENGFGKYKENVKYYYHQ